MMTEHPTERATVDEPPQAAGVNPPKRTTVDEPPVPPSVNPRKPWLRRPLLWVAVVATIALVIALGWLRLRPDPAVLVTDGSDEFADHLAKVEDLIETENNRVTASGKNFVSIAFMLPIRVDESDIRPPEAIRHELEGAYLAQYWSNREEAGEGQFTSSEPLIKLLIADSGQEGRDWSEAVQQLADRKDSDNLVAVAGLGSSVETTQLAANDLAANRLPMFGAVITSSRLRAPNLARVAPTNADEANAMIHHLRSTEQWQQATPADPYRGYLLQDTAVRDSYTPDLAEAYRAAFPDDETHTLLPQQGGYDGSASAVGNVLASHANTICALEVDVVFFAGRSNDLRTFLGKLDAQQCAEPSRTITVVAGDDVDHLTNSTELWQSDNIRVLYTGLASPLSWDEGNPDGRRAISRTAIARFTQGPRSYHAVFGDELDDSHAIMSYDAVLTAVEATRRVSTPDRPVPDSEALVNGLHQINAQNAVPGASGWIYFQNTQEPPEWLPHNKAVPVLSIGRNGETSLIRLSSKSGTPPGPPTVG